MLQHHLQYFSRQLPLLAGTLVLVLTATGLTYASRQFGQHLDETTAGTVASSHTGPVGRDTSTPAPTATAPTTPAPTAASAKTKAANQTIAQPVRAAAVSASARFGMSVGNTLPGLSAAELAKRLDDMKALGVGWLRLDLDWNDIQHSGPTSYTWTRFDAVVNAAHARGFQILPIITYTAPWARSSACASSFSCAPANPDQFATFAAAAVARYSPKGIHYWEIWNEPNQTGFWGPQPNAAAYTNLLRAAYPRIKQADPSATVITGGLASSNSSGGNIPQLDYLNSMYAAGAQPYFDAIGYHPYSFPVPPAYPADWNAWSKMGLNPTSFRSIMAAHGDAGKKIWITEYGAPTNGPGAIATTNNYNLNGSPDHVDEGFQAVIAAEFVRAVVASPWAGPAFWYSYKDSGTATDTTENFYGLIRADGSRKPAYASLQQAVSANP